LILLLIILSNDTYSLTSFRPHLHTLPRAHTAKLTTSKITLLVTK
ncbi:hypothetical protein BROOK1789C_710, partial [Bathymodiolus brooksi thiotrophic gill symbiont]